jgi:hypothetical protein
MEFRDDIDSDEPFDTTDDIPSPDSRLLFFQTNTPYRKFNNFLIALDNMRTAFKSRRRWHLKIRRNKNGLVFQTVQDPIDEKPVNYATTVNNDYYYPY